MNYIVTQVARPKKNTVPQMQGNGIDTVDKAMDSYLKNAVVSLASAKLQNPNAVCILNCDFDIPENMAQTAQKAGIQIHKVPFGGFASKEEFQWSITQYKFDSMAYVLKLMKDGDCMLLLDTDTVCMQNLDELFEEALQSLVLYPVPHTFSQTKRAEIRYNYKTIYAGESDNLVHYGGEFFAGSKKQLQRLLDACETVVQKARKAEGLKPWDDEHVLSIAVQRDLRDCVFPANAYVCRYWTNQFYLVSTNYYYDPVCVWHLPAEKNFGMLTLYQYYEKHACFPDIKKAARILGLPSVKYKRWNPYRWKMRILNKIKR